MSAIGVEPVSTNVEPRRWRWVVGGVAGLAVLIAILARPAGGSSSAATSGSSGGGVSFGGGDGKRVEVLAPRRGPIATTIEAPGTVQAGSEAGCGAPFEGRIVELCKDTGDVVKEGDVLFRLDATEKEETAREARIDVGRKEAAVAEAEAEERQALRKHNDAEREPSDLTEARLKVRQAELSFQRAKAQLESAESKLTRAQQMRAQGIGTPIDVEAASNEQRVSTISVRIAEEELSLANETMAFRERTWTEARAQAEKDLGVAAIRLRRAAADLESARVTLARAERDVERCNIVAPLDGVVTGRGVNHGDQVSRATGDVTHYIVSDLSRLLVYADVDEGDVGGCAEGQPARVRVSALGDEVRLTARVYDVGLRAEKKTGAEVPSVRVRILVDAGQPLAARLRPGMTASVEVETARQDEALKVPLQAIVQREVRVLSDAQRAATPAALLAGKQPHDVVDVVFTVVDGAARLVVVGKGLQDEDEAELLAGDVAPGAQVIVGPFRALERLEHDEKVRPGPAEVNLPSDAGVAPVATSS